MAHIPPSADLRAGCLPIRDQGPRATCLVFAASSVHEHARSLGEHLSTEALFRRCKSRDSLPDNAGTTVPAVLQSLRDDGQPVEHAWPYGSTAPAEPAAQWHHADLEGEEQSDPVRFVTQRIADGKLVAIALEMTDAWYAVGTDAVIPDPIPQEQLLGGHAVVAVGYDESAARVLIRNSWGSAWGNGGYAWLPYAQLEQHGWLAFTLEAI